MFWIIYISSITYCLWRIIKSYGRISMDGVVGPSPGLDTIMLIVFAPVLAVVDVSLTWIRLMKEAEESRIKKNKFL
jgi:hypothetical protein